jgi:hypothetical protein
MPILDVQRIPEIVVPGKRLGRHKHWDSRSLAYQVIPRDPRTLVSVLWAGHNDVLDQGDMGSCTGNSEVNAVATDPVWGALPSTHVALDEALAIKWYERATELDPFPGVMPPDDTGSDGLSACKAAKETGFISGYTHATSLAAMQTALQSGPAMLGLNWYDSFDQPASDGTVEISPNAEVRGGHEVCVRGIDVTRGMFRIVNSWSAEWGDHGYFQMSYATVDRLLHEDGDVTVPLPLTVPAPTPVPVPDPVPVPTPLSVDVTFATALHKWLGEHRFFYKSTQKAAAVWLTERGL